MLDHFKDNSKQKPKLKCSVCGTSVDYEKTTCPNCGKRMTSSDNHGDPIIRD